MRKYLDLIVLGVFLITCFSGFIYTMRELSTVKTNVETIICSANEC